MIDQFLFAANLAIISRFNPLIINTRKISPQKALFLPVN